MASVMNTLDTPAILDLADLDLADMAETVAACGVAAVDPRQIASLAQAARVAGASPVLVDVLTGPTEPHPARVRAFARLTTVLAGRTGTARAGGTVLAGGTQGVARVPQPR